MTPRTPAPEISVEEFARRRTRATEAARAQGLDALLVCSRGGGTIDRFANVVYLTNFYTSFPYIPDRSGDWTGRAHSFVILPVAGAPCLIADLPYLSEARMPSDQIVVVDDVLASLVHEIQRAGLARAKIGLVGEDVIPFSMMRAIQAALPDIRWSNAEGILTELRAIKSPAEIALLRDAAVLGSQALDAMLDAAVPGATHGDVVAAGQNVMARAGAVLSNSFMASGTGGESPTLDRYSFPTWASPKPLRKGQWFRIGLSGLLRSYYFDVSRTKPIGPATNAQIDAFEAAISVVEAGIGAIRVGAKAGEVADAALALQERLGYPIKSVFSGLGHGIGLGWDNPWFVAGEPLVLKPNMVLNVERTLMRDGYLGDFEETVLLTENGTELLTNAKIRRW
jgi:Xaa-Pro aminopeptidase